MTSRLFDLPLKKKAPFINLVSNARGSAAGLAAAEQAAAHQGLTLVIAKDTESATLLQTEIEFFLRDHALEVLSFPDWETLPYDRFSPHEDIISQRLLSLYRLPRLRQGVLIIPVNVLLQRLAPANYLENNSLVLTCGDRLDPERLRQRLASTGYRSVETVYEHGEFAQRGAILDIFPMGSSRPYRIELFDDDVETLRTFDPETQRSIDKLDEIRLLPGKEFPLSEEGIARFRQQWRETFDVDPRLCPTYQDVSDGLSPAGIEYYLPLFFDTTLSLLDYLPEETLIIHQQGLYDAASHFWSEIESRYESRRYDIHHPILAPGKAFHPLDSSFAQLKRFARIEISANPAEREEQLICPCQPAPEITTDARSASPYQALQHFVEQHPGRILFCAESAGRRETLLEILSKLEIKPDSFSSWRAFIEAEAPVGIITGAMERGLSLSTPPLHLITETQLYGRRVMQRRRRQKATDSTELVVRNLSELMIGAPVVHEQHGVGRYQGLQSLEIDGQANEFLMLSYADDAKLYVPVSSLDLISRYSGTTDELAPLHRLGSEQWQKARRKAAEKIRDTAAELLDIYARRAAKQGFAFDAPDDQYQMFAAGFPFEETPDQQATIDAVIADMRSPQPMDRLVCGDVGFGKTEVALRAAFVAVQSGKQVAVLAPTTLLAQQHYQTFQDRFADWPVQVEVISRFRTSKEQNSVAERLQSGQVDIVVGTHKLLQGSLNFQALGLLIVDEEHRFGVQQKERLKALRADMDILTLTATPIPRTLNMAMSSIRDLSIIATPPARRLSVKTFVQQSDTSLIKEAILRELLRGGQVYYLHNEVKTIEKTAKELQELVPEARIAVGHGQLRERELEQVMSDFYHKRFNLLVCTTIIETGIDIPNANTIIIDRADKFGLAQLHQLRGRVGRSHHQAYAYLLTPHVKVMTTDAHKRLEAIAAAHDLGAGFTLATHDLEIRGAGELLGEEQSGQMQSIGYSLYMEMLEQAIKAIKEGKSPDLDKPLHRGTEINLRMPALIPEDYLPDVHNRLMLYKRISSAKSNDDLKEMQVEMIDRFGLLPEAVKSLFRITELKLQAEKLGILRIDAGAKSGRIDFAPDTQVSPLTIVKLVQNQPQRYKLDGASGLKFSLEMPSADKRLQAINNLLSQLAA